MNDKQKELPSKETESRENNSKSDTTSKTNSEASSDNENNNSENGNKNKKSIFKRLEEIYNNTKGNLIFLTKLKNKEYLNVV